jgi:hypothetical protein
MLDDSCKIIWCFYVFAAYSSWVQLTGLLFGQESVSLVGAFKHESGHSHMPLPQD